ncbi:DUF1192 domain-containing protein [Ancylobacter sp. A5.8]|uniref:DUF1192 domain-containing protein n=1 Tax=Ancylobacter gelatini TaxID=2919920 RepID=UPI001F4D905E|nr:DUF1192 domain-containing protein [Ancylobacter gelatini]MCJ8144741.1 DUF1192 domain-containing protein [Ancylobacter gelatini]
MAIDDDVFSVRPARAPATHEIGADLSTLSEIELEERMTLLASEMERLRLALISKRASRAAADNFFKR